nr:MAG TPA: hypothetical protein [Caudoviricetes sp.]
MNRAGRRQNRPLESDRQKLIGFIVRRNLNGCRSGNSVLAVSEIVRII